MVPGKQYARAAEDFHRARQAADLQQVLARLTGRSTDLLSYEEVRHKLKATAATPRGLQDVPLDAVIGSEGRYNDFTRTFLPKHSSQLDRWARVFVATNSLKGLPPIELYQIGSAYFVKDGHHRISVARQLGATHIQARVYELQTRVPLSPEADMEEVILKAEYADFLEGTRIDELRPEADLGVTLPGQYGVLAEHIQTHRYFMGLEQQREIPYEEAVTHWYDAVYLPVVHVIRERGLLRDFPERTETDLYLWLMEHRAELAETLGWEVDALTAATDLVDRFGSRPGRALARLGEQVLEAVTPDGLSAGPPPGQWRRERVEPRGEVTLFHDLLVPIKDGECSWQALEQALHVAQREGGRVHGLHVSDPTEGEPEEDLADLQRRFAERCWAAGVEGQLIVEKGNVNPLIRDRARWTDLVVVKLSHPPGAQPLTRLSSGFRTLILRSPRPLLAVPREARPLEHALLAYDGSPKAREALYVATYLAGRWEIPLTVLAVRQEDQETTEALLQAQHYLEERSVHAAYVSEEGPVVAAILEVAERRGSSLIVMGGYGLNPVLGAVLGSAVDQMLRESPYPMLFCR